MDAPLTMAPKHGHTSFLFSELATDLDNLRADIAFLDLEHQLESGAVLVEWGDHADLSPLRSMPVGFEIARDDSRA